MSFGGRTSWDDIVWFKVGTRLDAASSLLKTFIWLGWGWVGLYLFVKCNNNPQLFHLLFFLEFQKAVYLTLCVSLLFVLLFHHYCFLILRSWPSSAQWIWKTSNLPSPLSSRLNKLADPSLISCQRPTYTFLPPEESESKIRAETWNFMKSPVRSSSFKIYSFLSHVNFASSPFSKGETRYVCVADTRNCTHK